jgi:2'-5' RNA ligase
MPRQNWFLAFPLDGAFLLELPAPPPQLRRFHPEDVHMTLAFLGGCGEEAALRALSVLDRELARLQPPAIDITLAEVVPMGSRRRYSALSALLGTGRAEATALLTQLRDPLTDAVDAQRDTRPAKPHITLARPKARATDTDRAAGVEWASGLDLGHVRARLDRIALYTWSEKRLDRLFRVVAERRLG